MGKLLNTILLSMQKSVKACRARKYLYAYDYSKTSLKMCELLLEFSKEDKYTDIEIHMVECLHKSVESFHNTIIELNRLSDTEDYENDRQKIIIKK